MSQYRLLPDLFLAPTPAGCFHVVESPEPTPERTLLRNLLRLASTPPLTAAGLLNWTETSSTDAAREVLWHAQRRGWVQGFDTERHAALGALEDLLPDLLHPLSRAGQALLADPQGFCVTSVGFEPRAATVLSAVSADLASLHDRHRAQLRQVGGIETSAWAAVDGIGNSQLGFWPLFVGSQRFVLSIAGLPLLNDPAFYELIWCLSTRYDREELAARTPTSETTALP